MSLLDETAVRWLRPANRQYRSDDNDRHRLTPAHRNRHILDAHCNRVTTDNALMKHLDFGALDEPELDQAAFELKRRQRGTGLAGGKPMDHPGKAAIGEAQGHLRVGAVNAGHDVLFSTTGLKVKLGGLKHG